MRLRRFCKATVLAILAASILPVLGRAQSASSSNDSPAVEGTARADDPRYGYIQLALKQIQQRHPQLQIPADVVRIVVDNKRLAKSLGFPEQLAREMDKGFMYTLSERGQFARPTFVNVKSQVWEMLIANQRQDDQREPIICVLSASLEHEIVGHMVRNDHDELAPTELEIAALRECTRGGLAAHPSIAGRVNWLDRRRETLRSATSTMATAKK